MDQTFYYRKPPQVSVLGCSEQYQMCSSAEKPESCTTKQGISQIERAEAFYDLSFNAQQLALASHVSQLLSLTTIRSLVNSLGAELLYGDTILSNSISTSVPDDQWKSEVLKFGKISHIVLRQALIDFAAGPPSKSWELSLQPPESGSIAQSFCSAQKINTTDYTSFNLLGLGIIFVVGSCLIILNLILPFTVSIFTRPRFQLHAYDPWLQDDPLHLQQKAFEEGGLGSWEGQDTDVPVTRPGQKMWPLWYKSPQPAFGANRVRTDLQLQAETDPEDNDESILLRPIPLSNEHSNKGMGRRATRDTLESYQIGEVTQAC